MGQKRVRFSDMSGDMIPDGEGAIVRIYWHNARRRPLAMDITTAEAEDLAKNAHPVQKRAPRRPRAEVKS